MDNFNDQASQAFSRISNSLVLLLEHIEPNTFEYDLIELLADYSYDKAKQMSPISSTNCSEMSVSLENLEKRYA